MTDSRCTPCRMFYTTLGAASSDMDCVFFTGIKIQGGVLEITRHSDPDWKSRDVCGAWPGYLGWSILGFIEHRTRVYRT